MKIYHHDFKRDRNASFCYICQDAWPANETSVSKYDTCAICGLFDDGISISDLVIIDVVVHTGCRDFAKTCYPCDPTTTHQRLTSQYLHDINRSGLTDKLSDLFW
jgi:hypothetical protein